MKYKIYEKLTDFFRTKLFSKTNIAIVACASLVLNVAMVGMLYDEQKDFDALSAVYAFVQENVPVSDSAVQKTTQEKQQETTVRESSSETEKETAATSLNEAEDITAAEKESISSDPETSATESAEDVPSDQTTYYVTNSGKKYHVSTCSYLSKSRNAITLSQAKAKGFSPCSRCIKQ